MHVILSKRTLISWAAGKQHGNGFVNCLLSADRSFSTECLLSGVYRSWRCLGYLPLSPPPSYTSLCACTFTPWSVFSLYWYNMYPCLSSVHGYAKKTSFSVHGLVPEKTNKRTNKPKEHKKVFQSLGRTLRYDYTCSCLFLFCEKHWDWITCAPVFLYRTLRYNYTCSCRFVKKQWDWITHVPVCLWRTLRYNDMCSCRFVKNIETEWHMFQSLCGEHWDIITPVLVALWKTLRLNDTCSSLFVENTEI